MPIRLSLHVATIALALLGGCRDNGLEPTTGALTVGFDGLASGTPVTVEVKDPILSDVEQVHLVGGAASVTLRDLAPGAYVVMAPAIFLDGHRYTPTPGTLTVQVRAGTTAMARFNYRISSARLAVTIAGLPPGLPADVWVVGTTGQGQTLTTSQTLVMLVPGPYVIEANDVETGEGTFSASPARQVLTLGPSTTPQEVRVTYNAVTPSAGVGGIAGR